MRSVHVACLLLLFGAAACRDGDAPRAAPETARTANASSEWGHLGGHRDAPNTATARAVQERPIEITGVPFIRAFRLAWTRSADVPTWEPDNQTRRMPGDVLQAVLLVDVAGMPRDARLRVLWYYGDALAFTDVLAGRDDGEHLFSLVKREGGRMIPLPHGGYRAEVYDGGSMIKSIPFDIGGAR